MRNAFTLIELLVVVTVIAVLLALLTPALDRAVNAAAVARCGANLHAVGLATHLYLQDHKGRYPQLTSYYTLMGNAGVNDTTDVRARPLNQYLSYLSNGTRVAVAECPSDKGDSFENPSLGSVKSYDKWGTSYLPAWWHDPISRVKAVFGSSNTSPLIGVTASATRRQFRRADNKLILADWPWYSNRHYHLEPNQWHTGDPLDRRYNTLFADAHVELFYFDRNEIEDGQGGYGNPAHLFNTPANPSFTWW